MSQASDALAALVLGDPMQLERQLHIVERGTPRQQPILLEHGGDLAAEMIEVAVGRLAADHDRAGGRRLEADHQIEESRFAATGLADDRHHLARRDVEIEPFDRDDRLAGRGLPEDLAQLRAPRSAADRSCPPSQHAAVRRRATTASSRNSSATSTSVQANTSATENSSCATAS